jgi:hypothetical protein
MSLSKSEVGTEMNRAHQNIVRSSRTGQIKNTELFRVKDPESFGAFVVALNLAAALEHQASVILEHSKTINAQLKAYVNRSAKCQGRLGINISEIEASKAQVKAGRSTLNSMNMEGFDLTMAALRAAPRGTITQTGRTDRTGAAK